MCVAAMGVRKMFSSALPDFCYTLEVCHGIVTSSIDFFFSPQKIQSFDITEILQDTLPGRTLVQAPCGIGVFQLVWF